MDPRTYRERRRQAQLNPSESRDLTRAVLARTTGGTCARSHHVLPSFVDGDLDAGTTALLQEHLDGCVGCQALGATLWQLRIVLPAMADMAPGNAFAARVIAATTTLAAERARQAAASVTWWTRVVARPRFSLEVAYVCTLLFILVIGNPAMFAETLKGKAQALTASAAEAVGQRVDRARDDPRVVHGRQTLSAWLDTAVSDVIASPVVARKWLGWLADQTMAAWKNAWGWLAGVLRDISSWWSRSAGTERSAPGVRVDQQRAGNVACGFRRHTPAERG